MNLEPTFSEGNSIESADKNLIPANEDYSPLVAALPESGFIPPLYKDFSLIEERVTLDENGEIIDNNLHFDRPGLENDLSEYVSYTYNSSGDIIGIKGVAADTSSLEFVGGFGDYNGGNDLTYTVKDNQNNNIETFSMTGAGQGTLYKDATKEYIFFSGTNETTKVNISAISDLEFEDYTGDSLSIQTAGSIKGGNITLNDENTEENSGLTLRAGTGTQDSISSVFDKYNAIDFYDREMVDINNYVEIVGNDDYSGRDEFFFYDTQSLYYLPGYYSSRAFGINDNTQMIGEGLPTASDTKYRPFVAYGDGSTQEIVYGGNGGRFNSNSSPENTITYIPQGYLRDINNYFETAYYQLNTPPANTPPELGLTPFEDAYFNAPTGGRRQTVNIGYTLLNSYNSRVFGINDLSQVVGINRETDKAFVFDYASNSVTNLGTLAGGNSAAYAINDSGQIVGSSDSRAFIYENGTMKDMGIPYTGDPEKRDGIDINNVGQAVVTSSAGEPLIYQNGVVTNANDWLNPDAYSKYRITEVKSINDLGYIIAQGTLKNDASNSNHGFLLAPTFKNVNRNINVGNISTFGETVLLEGAEVYLEGESIVTQGGNIESNGKTIVNNNLVIDSSITDESVGNPNADSVIAKSGAKIAGGDIAFTDTLNTNSVGDQNLTIKAGAGDLLFANTVGDTNPVFDLTVEGAGSLTAIGDLTVGHELKLEVINEIIATNITTAGLAKISLGKVGKDIFTSTGNFRTGNIQALSLEVANNGNFTAGNITTSNGGLEIISLNALSVDRLEAKNGGVNLISGTAGIEIDGTINADRSIFASGKLNVTSGDITSAQNAVIFNSSQGTVTVNGSVSALGEISLASANDVTVNTVTSSENTVTLVSATGTIRNTGAIFGKEDVNLASLKDLTITKTIKANDGSISLASLEGSVISNVTIKSGFNIDISAKKNIRTLGISNGGSIGLSAELGQINVLNNVVSGGGDISILAAQNVEIGNIISKSGNINVSSVNKSIKTGYIRTDYLSREGDVYLYAKNNLRISNAVNINGIDYSIYTGERGKIDIVNGLKSIASNSANLPVDNNIVASGVIGAKTAPIRFLPGAGSAAGIVIGKTFIWIGVFGEILNVGENSPLHQGEINPVTGQPYLDEQELKLIGQLTEEQTETLRGIWNTKNPKYAPYIPRDEEDEPKYAIDTRRGCFSLELKGHLGDNPEFSSGIHPDILAAARKYASDMTGSENDYLVITPFGTSAFYDGLVNSEGDADKVIPDIPDRPRKVVEAKYGYKFLSKLIDKEEDLPVGFVRDPNLIRDSNEATPNEKNILEKMRIELNGEALVAEACHLNYAATFSNNVAGRSAKELFTFPETNITNFSVATYFIRPLSS